MIMRHAEKPTDELAGVHPNGDQSENCLIARGWQRAGALVPYFAHPHNRKLATPTHLMAANREAPGADPKEASLREEQTLAPLADALKTPLDVSCGKGMEADVARIAQAHDGPVLIAWDHNKICELARLISTDTAVPHQWPSDRFDMIFALRLKPGSLDYTFEQVPQMLLAGDRAEPIPV